MISAKELFDKLRDGGYRADIFFHQMNLEEGVKLIEARDTAIRKECADRAVAWYLQGVPEPSRAEYAEEVAELRAAIMGE